MCRLLTPFWPSGSIYTVALFRSTDRLAAAYGIAVTGTMAITTVAYYLVTRKTWQRARLLALPICAVFLLVDLAFFCSNSRKIRRGRLVSPRHWR
jgi:KUP system potassium uptake protein